MTRWEVFEEICTTLRLGLLQGSRPSSLAGVDGESLIRISSQHVVSPALAWCVRDVAGLVPEVAAYFEATLALNADRNALLLGAVERIAARLNAVGIEPMLLKGIAYLADGIYPSAATRFLGDIDILVPERAIDLARATLSQAGFFPDPDDPLEADHHHLPMMHEQATGIGVELHHQLAMAPWDRLLPASWIWENARRLDLGTASVRLPDPTRAIAHAVVHDQLIHHQYRWRGLELRQVLDTVMLRTAFPDRIDWEVLDHRFRVMGQGQVLATQVAFAEALFGLPSPKLACRPRRRFLEQFERRSARWPTIRRLASDYIHARRQRPAAILKLLQPSTWPNRVERIATGFKMDV